MYPSPQMFFNAMQRKGYNPNEAEMSTVVVCVATPCLAPISGAAAAA